MARILRIHGLEIAEGAGAAVSATSGASGGRATGQRGNRPEPRDIELHEPPTYIRIVWDEAEPISFYPEQRRYVRIETDANSNYHDPLRPANSRINIITTGTAVRQCGSTPLKGGRLRGIFECPPDAKVGESGILRVELSRPGQPVLSDEKPYSIVTKPPVKEPERKVKVPPFRLRPVRDVDDPLWAELGWPDNPSEVASAAAMTDGTLEVFYSLIFTGFKNRLTRLEERDAGLAKSFSLRYGIWLAVHSLLYYQDQLEKDRRATDSEPEDDRQEPERFENQERCRMATISAIFAQRETEFSAGPSTSDD